MWSRFSRTWAQVKGRAGVVAAEVDLAADGPVAGDAARTWADTGRARRLLGWTATTGLTEGPADQIAWHRAARVHEEVRAG